MQLRNTIGIETRLGYRRFELWHGDLTQPEAAADVLVVSAFAGDYAPVPGTLLAALHAKWGWDLRASALNPFLDLRQALSIWVSPNLEGGHFPRLLVAEIRGAALSLRDVIRNVFVGVAILEARGEPVRSIAMPVLGAGNQKLDPAEVVAVLIPEARQALERSASLERILFVERDSSRVAVLDQAIEENLQRARVYLPRKEVNGQLLREIGIKLDRLAPLLNEAGRRTVAEAQRLLHEGSRALEIGLAARRVTELLVGELLAENGSIKDLAQRIEQTDKLGVAPWVRSYFHLMRLFGNESAHTKTADHRHPRHVEQEDLPVCLFCLERALAVRLARAETDSSTAAEAKARGEQGGHPGG
jgi:O-acetyl-ADP-ribose deacetylase (regulator of RNase III)